MYKILQAMGRIGEVITRTWQTADKMKRFRGRLKQEKVCLFNTQQLGQKKLIICFSGTARVTFNPPHQKFLLHFQYSH